MGLFWKEKTLSYNRRNTVPRGINAGGIMNSRVPLILHTKFQLYILKNKSILMVLLFLVLMAILDSEVDQSEALQSDHVACEMLLNCFTSTVNI